MMTAIHTDLVRHSTPAVPTPHERQALRIRRQARRALLSAFISSLLSQAPRVPVVANRSRADSRS